MQHSMQHPATTYQEGRHHHQQHHHNENNQRIILQEQMQLMQQQQQRLQHMKQQRQHIQHQVYQQPISSQNGFPQQQHYLNLQNQQPQQQIQQQLNHPAQHYRERPQPQRIVLQQQSQRPQMQQHSHHSALAPSKKRQRTEIGTKALTTPNSKKKPDPTTTTTPGYGSKLISQEVPTEILGDGLVFTKGWIKITKERLGGNSRGTRDSYWISPIQKYKFRSIPEVRRFLRLLALFDGDEVRAKQAFKKKSKKGDGTNANNIANGNNNANASSLPSRKTIVTSNSSVNNNNANNNSSSSMARSASASSSFPNEQKPAAVTDAAVASQPAEIPQALLEQKNQKAILSSHGAKTIAAPANKSTTTLAPVLPIATPSKEAAAPKEAQAANKNHNAQQLRKEQLRQRRHRQQIRIKMRKFEKPNEQDVAEQPQQISTAAAARIPKPSSAVAIAAAIATQVTTQKQDKASSISKAAAKQEQLPKVGMTTNDNKSSNATTAHGSSPLVATSTTAKSGTLAVAEQQTTPHPPPSQTSISNTEATAEIIDLTQTDESTAQPKRSIDPNTAAINLRKKPHVFFEEKRIVVSEQKIGLCLDCSGRKVVVLEVNNPNLKGKINRLDKLMMIGFTNVSHMGVTDVVRTLNASPRPVVLTLHTPLIQQHVNGTNMSVPLLQVVQKAQQTSSASEGTIGEKKQQQPTPIPEFHGPNQTAALAKAEALSSEAENTIAALSDEIQFPDDHVVL